MADHIDIEEKTEALAEVEIEGLDEKEEASWGDYPLDTIHIRNETRTVFDVLRRIRAGTFVMDPEFQRDFIWDIDKQSKFIESVLMRIPLPVFYLAENEQGQVVVVDGLQRLSTFKSFITGELRLKIPVHDVLNNKRFEDLAPKLQNRIEDCNLILYIIDSKAPERARLDIFERVNGGVPLTRQQMRNCLFMGPATRFLKDESRTDIFSEATGKSLKTNTMRDREFVNRFCAFQLLTPDNYRGDMDDFLARALQTMNEMQSEELEKLSKQFQTGLTNNFKVFGKHAFRKYHNKLERILLDMRNDRRSVINASLWDVMSTGLSRYSKELVASREQDLRSSFWILMQDYTFEESITYSTNGLRQVKQRFQAVHTMLHEVFNDHSD